MHHDEPERHPVDSESDAGSLAQRLSLRIGCPEARPWSYRAEDALLGLDVAAIEYVAGRLAMTPEYRIKPEADLASGLLDGEYDIAIGGLLSYGHAGIHAIEVPHARVWTGATSETRARIRRVFFPNVWWIRRNDLGLRYRLRFLLLRWRFSARGGAASRQPGPIDTGG